MTRTLVAKHSGINFQPAQIGCKTYTWVVEERQITCFALAASYDTEYTRTAVAILAIGLTILRVQREDINIFM